MRDHPKSIFRQVSLVLPMAALMMVIACVTATGQEVSSKIDPVAFDVKLDVVLQRDKDDWCWAHPRTTVIPNSHDVGKPKVLMTINREFLGESDFFTGTYVMQTDDKGKS